jgi:serine protease Do
MDQFVCVRLVQTNGLDLTLFQFDFDLTFSVFFLNADKTIYGRFGTRSSREEATEDITISGFRKSLEGALALHKRYPENKVSLSGKRVPDPQFKVPEEYPSLSQFKPTLDYVGNVVKSCMHCHQVHDAQRLVARSARKPIPESVLYPWPMPDVVGLKLDAKQRATVEHVDAGSAAERAGFKSGDELLALEGQPLLSIADVQWVLHNAGTTAELKALVRRGERTGNLTLSLDEGWRRQANISWRTSSWDLRRIAAGGMLLEDLADDERPKSGLDENSMALLVKYVGQYGEHAVAKNAGFVKNDILVAVDGKTGRMSETDFFAYVLQNKMPGEKVPMTVLRGGKRVELTLPLP